MQAGERRSRVAIVGGGIAGLAAAFFLRDAHADVTVLEGSPRLGGKLAVSEVAGVPVDSGAEALLARRPEGTDLIAAVGLAGELVDAATAAASLWTRGEFRPLPTRQFMGVPAEFDDLERSRILSPAGMDRARQDASLPATPRDGDVPVAAYVAARFGTEVVDRLVEPLLGGVYAGRPEQLSFEATLPVLAQVSSQHASLAEAAASALGPPPGRGSERQPVFTTLAGGLGMLPEALARASGAMMRTRATARVLRRTGVGWRLTVGPASAPESVEADAVIIALPGGPAGRLLAGADGAGGAAAALAEIPYASMAIVRRRPRCAGGGGSGGGDRCDRAASGHPCDPVGRRAAPVHDRSPRPGSPDQGRRGRTAGLGGVRGGVRRDRHPGVHRLGAACGGWRTCVPGRMAAWLRRETSIS